MERNFTTTDVDLQCLLTACAVEWTILTHSEAQEAEANWRSIYEQSLAGLSRYRTAHRARAEYQQQPESTYCIVPFSRNVTGFPISIDSRYRMAAYACQGPLVALDDFHNNEFFLAPQDFSWTMVHTHEDGSWGGPYFIQRDWVYTPEEEALLGKKPGRHKGRRKW